MPLEKISIFGNPNIGVYVFVNNEIALVPKGLDLAVIRKIEETLGVRAIDVSIAGTTLVGVMVAGNDHGILLPRTVTDEELRKIKSEFRGIVTVLQSHFTALGNVILANNRGALVHPEMEESLIKVIKETLGIEEIVKGTIAKVPTPGSVGVVTDLGGIVHSDATEEELKNLSENVFKVPLDTGSVNFGIAFIRTGLVANNKGALVGELTTGPEILRIIRALRLKV